MRCHIRQRGVLEDMFPMVREAAKRVVLTLPREDVRADIVGAPSFEILDDRQPNGTDGFTLLTVFQPQAARLGVRLHESLIRVRCRRRIVWGHCSRTRSAGIAGVGHRVSAKLTLVFYSVTRASAQVSSASRAGHSSCPHSVRPYSTFGGT